jgi:hypothetical protein
LFVKNGLASAKVIPDGVTAIVRLDSDQQAVTPSSAYRASGWVACATARTVQLNVNWYDAAHVFIATSTGSIAVAGATWTFISSIFLAPFNAAYAAIIPTLTGTPTAADYLNADDIQLAPTGGATLTNPGDVPSYPIWQLTGPFTGITATNSTTGKTWTISYTAGSGDTLTLDTTPGRTSLVNVSGVNQWDKLISGYQLWPIVGGNNVLAVSVNGATSASLARLTYTPRFESD